MKVCRRISLIPVILILILAPPGGHCSERRSTLKLLDVNVWSGLDYKGYLKMGEYETAGVRENRFQALVTQIKTLDPDIIAIHEANKLPAYAKRLSGELGYEAFYHVGVGGVRVGPVGLPWNLREGDAILARKSLKPVFVGRNQLSGGYVGKWATFHFKDATQIIAIRITYRNKPVYVFATHWHASLSDSPEILKTAKKIYETGAVSKGAYHRTLSKIEAGVAWRMSESKKTVDFVKSSVKGNPFILMGDFNAESPSGEIRNLVNAGMVDAFETVNPNASGFTWNPKTNLNQIAHYLDNKTNDESDHLFGRLEKMRREIPRRIDYIFVGPASFLKSGKMALKSSKVVLDKVLHGIHASDHYGVFAELVIYD
jgi:endonuclease/exonuclease/phosphatase family metal-dependent hydrolase